MLFPSLSRVISRPPDIHAFGPVPFAHAGLINPCTRLSWASGFGLLSPALGFQNPAPPSAERPRAPPSGTVPGALFPNQTAFLDLSRDKGKRRSAQG
jgi:hypothetical protein